MTFWSPAICLRRVTSSGESLEGVELSIRHNQHICCQNRAGLEDRQNMCLGLAGSMPLMTDRGNDGKNEKRDEAFSGKLFGTASARF